jgi:hypothetical protein
MSISTWAMTNGYIQCVGCGGYGPHDAALWRLWRVGVLMPYCTEECVEVDA